MFRKALAPLAFVLVQACVLAPAHGQETRSPAPSFTKTDRLTLAQLRVTGKKDTMLLVVTPEGKTAGVEESLRQNACDIKAVAREIGYIRCVISLDRLEAVSKLPGIEKMALSATQLSTVYGLSDQASETATGLPKSRSVGAPTRFMPRDNPFTASRAMQVLSFKDAHPSYDGRGSAVGVLESEIDLLTPELKWAENLNGERVPKLIDWTLTGEWDLPDPAMPDWMYASFLSGSPWTKVRHPFFAIPTDKVEEVRKGVVRFRGDEYVLPNVLGNVDWRMGVWDAHKVEPPFGPLDTNLDGVVNDSDNYTILFDAQGKRVWVDLNHNKAFGDETPLRDFSVAREFGVFGKDDPNTAVRESRTFFIHLEPDKTDVWMQVDIGEHGDMVSSVLAGNKFLGSEADGVAPGAQVVLHSMVEGFTHNYIETLLRAFRDRRTDLITFSGGDDIRPTDGRHILDLLTSRMIDVYHKPIFIAAGNSGPAMGGLNSPSVAAKAFSVGAYTPPEAWKANFGVTPTTPETLAPYSATGPTDSGGMKPDLLGVTGTLSTTPGFMKGFPIQKLYYTPPPGYMVSGGTSAATPTAAGTAALLISAAKQAGIPYDVARLRTALLSTARFLPGVEARKQGNGVIQVADAWQALEKLKVPDWEPVDIVSDAPVKTATSRRLRVPDRGVGIFEREGWNSGMTGIREIVFTRKSGPPKPLSYKLQWKGDTDVFTSAGEITLPLNQAVRLPVRITPSGSGAFSAVASLLDSHSGLIAYQTLNTIVVPYVLNAADAYQIEVSGKAPRPGNADVFVAVPAGTEVLHVHAKLKGCRAALEFTAPDGNFPVRLGGAIPNNENVFTPVKDGEIQRSFDDPMPGVWQISIADGSDFATYDEEAGDPLQPCEFTLDASALGVDIEMPARSVKAGQEYSAQMANRLANFNGRIEGLGLGSARTDRPTLGSELQQVIYDLDVPKGTTRLEAVISDASDSLADVDLYLFDGSGESAYLAAYSVSDGSKKRVEVLDPKPGKWKVVVDPYRLPNGPIQISYRDTFYHDSFGKIEITSNKPGMEKSQGSAAWFSAEVHARPEKERSLVGAIEVVSDDVYVTITDPEARVPEPNPLELPKPVPTKKVPIRIQRLVFAVE